MSAPILDIRDLHLAFRDIGGYAEVLHGISLSVAPAERVALVGESGSGKSVTARAIMGLVQSRSNVRISGHIAFEGQDMVRLAEAERQRLRGTRMSMIFQDPVSALNPFYRIEDQFHEVVRRSQPSISLEAAREAATRLLLDVSIDDPQRVLSSFPFQLSGGMCQRVMIAMALINSPSLLIADEPGTALDVTVQDQTLDLMRRLVERKQAAVLFISHNLGVVREFSDRLYIIYRGRVVETGPTTAIFEDPRHPYTRALIAAVPRITRATLPDLDESRANFSEPCVVHELRSA